MVLPTRFSVRVYGFLLSPMNEILLSFEKINDFAFIKFPGGGLEFGEGPQQCLIREMKEECGISVEILRYIYTSGDFIQSHFIPEAQVIGIYYHIAPVHLNDLQKIVSGKESIQTFNNQNNTITHQWIPLQEMADDKLSFPMDKMAFAAFANILAQ